MGKSFEHGLLERSVAGIILTDTRLRNLKPKDKLYKVNDRSRSLHFSIHGRQDTVTFGRYAVGGITLAEARERLGEAKKTITAGKSPAKRKRRAHPLSPVPSH